MRRLTCLLFMGLLAGLFAACSSSPPTYLARDQLLDPQTCQMCHPNHFRDWSGSMHAYASDDPLFVAMNQRGQRETNGALGNFCVSCHAPMAVHEGATTNGLNLGQVPAKLKGVTCFFCHTVDSVGGTHNDPLHLADDTIMRAAYSDPVANTAHAAMASDLQNRDHLESAQLCGACHDIVTGAGAAIERTYSEWQASVFSHAPGGTTCGQCHMNQSATLEPIAQAPNVFARRSHSHALPAIDLALTPFAQADDQRQQVQRFLDTTLQSAVCVASVGQRSMIRVILDNVAGGHGFPSGAAQDRRVFVEVVAYQGGNMIYQSGAVPDGMDVTAQPAMTDPDLWLLRDCMYDTMSKPVHMFWQAASYEGNELPGQATFDMRDPRYYQTHIVQSYPRGGTMTIPTFAGMPDRVTVRVRVQPVGLDVVDDLIASGDLDAAVRPKLVPLTAGSDRPLEWTTATATDSYFEDNTFLFKCVTTTNLNVQADKVPAKANQHCMP